MLFDLLVAAIGPILWTLLGAALIGLALEIRAKYRAAQRQQRPPRTLAEHNAKKVWLLSEESNGQTHPIQKYQQDSDGWDYSTRSTLNMSFLQNPPKRA